MPEYSSAPTKTRFGLRQDRGSSKPCCPGWRAPLMGERARSRARCIRIDRRTGVGLRVAVEHDVRIPRVRFDGRERKHLVIGDHFA